MPTIKDIAKKANVSKSTVSKVINNYPGVNEKTKKQVLKVMRENNYWPNAIARSLSTNKSYTIGIFDPSRLNNFFFREVLEGIEDYLGKSGFDILYFTNKKWGDTWVDFGYKEKCYNRNVDGAMLLGFGKSNLDQFEELLESDIPVVFVDLKIMGKKASYVISDNVQGAYKAVKYLYELGHRKIAMMMGQNSFPDQERFLGYQTALEEFDLEYNPDWVFTIDYRLEDKGGYEVMQKIIAMENRPTAIFTEDIFAIGAIRAIRDSQLKVPGDFSIIGFDNIELSRHYDLTTINQQQYEMGQAAAKLLLKIINGENFSPVTMPTELVERKTCGKPK